MSTPFMGQIQAFAFGLVPKGWASCNGQLMAINQNQALYSLLGTNYGGDGQTTFGLPNLQGQTPLCMGSGFSIGQASGEANHTLTTAEMPIHIHPLVASSAQVPTAAISPITGGFPGVLGAVPGNSFATTTDNTLLGPGSSPAGGSQSHTNMQPYLALNFCIALQGIYPTRQ